MFLYKYSRAIIWGIISGLIVLASSCMIVKEVTEETTTANVQFYPSMVSLSGPYRVSGISMANGIADYVKLLNERDGGINGIKLMFEECDTAYQKELGLECYNRMKNKGPTGAPTFSPMSTTITYALIEQATADNIPVFSMGYGRTDASDGRIFPYIFTMPTSYWSQATAIIKYIGSEEGGMNNLQGKKIGLLYHDSAYGKEPIPVLEKLMEMYGYQLNTFPVAHPGLDQKEAWQQIAYEVQPDWLLLWGWGEMNATAIKEATLHYYPIDKFIGNWWSGSEQDVLPVGKKAIGYKSTAFHASGTSFSVYDDIMTYLYDKGIGTSKKIEDVGTVLYNRGLINTVITTEAIRTAQTRYGQIPLTGEQVRWGFENLHLTAKRLKELGLEGFMQPINVSCEDHEGNGPIHIQQWDGKQWQLVSDWIEPMRDVVRPMIEASAARYAHENGITPRDCTKNNH